MRIATALFDALCAVKHLFSSAARTVPLLLALSILSVIVGGCTNLGFDAMLFSGEPRLTISSADAGTWTRIDSGTVRFEGVITQETWKEFLAITDSDTRRMIINSGGGDVASAIHVADIIRDAHIELVVDGYCLSSCANYWAVASPQVSLNEGVIGFHGNLTGCVKLYGGIEPYVTKDLPADATREQFDRVAEQVLHAIELEAAFYGHNGMPDSLPIEYCRLDKGLVNGRTLSFIAPNEHQLRLLGVHLQVGSRQSKARIAEYNAKYANPIVLY